MTCARLRLLDYYCPNGSWRGQLFYARIWSQNWSHHSSELSRCDVGQICSHQISQRSEDLSPSRRLWKCFVKRIQNEIDCDMSLCSIFVPWTLDISVVYLLRRFKKCYNHFATVLRWVTTSVLASKCEDRRQSHHPLSIIFQKSITFELLDQSTEYNTHNSTLNTVAMHSSCPKCGASITTGTKTCGSCGTVRS